MSDLTPETLAEWRGEASVCPQYPTQAEVRIIALLDALRDEQQAREQAERERDFLLRWGEDMEAQRDEETAALSDLRAAVKALADKWERDNGRIVPRCGAALRALLAETDA